MKIKAKIYTKKFYQISVNETPIGEFEFKEGWNGLKELKNEDGKLIISGDEDNGFFENIFNGDRDAEINIISASPNITEKILDIKNSTTTEPSKGA